MFIQTEETPNPDALKFLPQMSVMTDGRVPSFRVGKTDTDQVRAFSPISADLLEIPGIVGVMLGSDFIVVTKEADRSFDDLKPLVLLVMMEYIMQGAPFYKGPRADQAAATKAGSSFANDEIVTQICDLIASRVRPAVAGDGGDITFSHFKDGIVYVEMRGACAGCPSSTRTLKIGVENMLKHYIPEVREVRAVSDWA